MKSRAHYFILMHLVVIVWGFTGILGRLIQLPADVLVWYRMSIAALSLLIMLPLMKVSLVPRHKKDILKIFMAGIVVSLHWVTFFKAISLSTASLGVLCLSITAFHISWIEPIIMKKKFSKVEMLLGLLVAYAIYFISSDFQPGEYEALAYGMASAIFAALFSVLNEKLVQTIPSPQIVFYEMWSGAIFLFLVLLFSDQIHPEMLVMKQSDLIYLLILGVVCTGIPFILWIIVIKRLGAFTASLIINLEPVYTMILAVFILKENEIVGPRFYTGALLIIAIVAFDTIYKNRTKHRPYWSYRKKRISKG